MESRDLEITVVIGAALPFLGALGCDLSTLVALVGVGVVLCWVPVIADAIGVRA